MKRLITKRRSFSLMIIIAICAITTKLLLQKFDTDARTYDVKVYAATPKTDASFYLSIAEL